jgi:chromate transporter
LLWKSKFDTEPKEHLGSTLSVIGDDKESPPHTKPNLARGFRVAVLWLTLWLTPILIVGSVRGWESTLFKEGLFFTKAAVVTFGGAYAVLPYVAQQPSFIMAG